VSPPSNARALFALLFLITVAFAIFLRAPGLTRRPMHTDEAVHAVKFGMLLEEGDYRYDRVEYHGPTLNYFTLIPAVLESAARLSEIDESTLRIVPVAFGVGVVALLLLLVPGLGRGTVVAIGLLTAVSPAMVFYSRYYIQEMLLVFFTLGVIACGFRYSRSKRLRWALAAGSFLGLMHATKETAVLAVGAMGIALAVTLMMGRRRLDLSTVGGHGIFAALTAMAVSALFFSSFFANPVGVLDSYTTYVNYAGRATAHDFHIQPWHYYVSMLVYFEGPSGKVWSEGAILLLAGAGVFAAAVGRGAPGVDRDLHRFLCAYALVLLLIYSLIPYKTPWSMLGALHGLILVAGIGATFLVSAARSKPASAALLLVLLLAGAHLAWQSHLATHQYNADPNNPYVYSHPTDDVFRIAGRVQAVADVHPDGNDLFIEVVSPLSDYWPLPWYLRRFPNTGWWQEVDMDVPAAPLIIAAPSAEAAVLTKLYEVPAPGERYLYVPLFDEYTEIRPTVEVRGYVSKELWDALQREEGTP